MFPAKKMDDRRPGDFVYRWTRELTQQLILWRVANKNLFTGKRNAARKGFEVFIKQMGLEGKVSVASVKKKWENLKQKYKELKNQSNGGSTHGAVTADTWTWYRAMDEALEFSNSIICLTVGSSFVVDGTVFSVPSEGKTDASNSCLDSTAAASDSGLSSNAATDSCLSSNAAASNSGLSSNAASDSGLSSNAAASNSSLSSNAASDSCVSSNAAASNSGLSSNAAASDSCVSSNAASDSCLNSTTASNSCLSSNAASNSCFSPTTASSSSALVFLQQYEQVNASIVKGLQPIVTGYVLKWTDELVEQLILWRVANKNLFTGKRNAARKGFEVFIKEMELEGKVTVASVKKKWENLKQKYKELKYPTNGGSTQGGVTAGTWKWYRAMDEALDFNHSITCMTVEASSAVDGILFSVPSEGQTDASSSCLNSTATSNSCLDSTAASNSGLSSDAASNTCLDSTATTAASNSCLSSNAASNTCLDSIATASNSCLNSKATSNSCLISTAVASGSCFSSTTASSIRPTAAAVSSSCFSSTAPEPPSKRAKKEPEWLLAIKAASNTCLDSTASNSCLSSNAASNSCLDSKATSISCLNPTAVASSSCFSSTTASSSCIRPTAAAIPCFTSPAVSSSCFSSTAPEPPSKRAKKEPEWLLAIKELERREEARDARQAEWERAMMEREKRRDRETMEREERRDQEMKEREERRDREMREREERLIAENREREDRQAKEAAAREERFLALMDFLVKK